MINTPHPLQPPPLKKQDQRLHWGGLQGSAVALALSQLALQQSRPLCIVCGDIHEARQLLHELQFFLGDSQPSALPLLFFPDWETLPYDHFAPHQDLIAERLTVLEQLPRLTQGIVITALSTLMHRLPPSDYLAGHTLLLSTGQTLDPTRFREQLVHAGYHFVNQVGTHGEVAQRGAIFDLFPMGSEQPLRLEFFDNDLESIRYFDPDTQRSTTPIDRICLLPAREYPLHEKGITQFRQQWRARFHGNPLESPLYQSISQGIAANGAEYYLPLFYPQLSSLLDYLPSNTVLVATRSLAPLATQFWEEITRRYEQLRHDLQRPLCPPAEVFIPDQVLFGQFNQFQQLRIDHDKSHCHFNTQTPPTLTIDYQHNQPLAALTAFIQQSPCRILFCAESTGRRETLRDLLRSVGIIPVAINSWQDFLAVNSPYALCVGELDQGLWLPASPITEQQSLCIITEAQLFGAQVKQRRLRKSRGQDIHTMIKNLAELQPGAPVVHIDHGVGRYLGLELITTGDNVGEYLTLEYADNDRIYVPVTALHCISRYTGIDAAHAPLQKLGNKKWQKQKEQAAQQIRDVAAELLAIYSQRAATPGFAIKPPGPDYWRFVQSFPFETTIDQENAIQAVTKDMTASRSMDRLICGDVGFGKTEVALRAAFLAVQGGKQVALLVPTTLLANQHWQNFCDRFADWPVQVANLSRIRTVKENQATLAGLANGQVDIVVGTHKLLSPDIQFHDLGLLIVDEEHRFGVRQKDQIKALRAHVDILTLTATPIPRTLNMALAGTRDLSLITTPPARRLAVKTLIHAYDKTLIREALLRETLRGGQVYFLHNEVSSIEAMSVQLQELLPQARIAIAHGQMPERQLEKVMADFYHQKFNILLCTTIVESGIDVPSANTILINNADRFGLAQLHQLRGRVGRSHHQAYAYLLTVPDKKLTPEADKRLTAFSALEELGAGFMLATHDLEIRGAGELLGDAQSGHIQTIGYALYMELLEEAIKALQKGEEPDFKPSSATQGPEINLNTSAFLPHNYVPDVNARLMFYKRITQCQSEAEFDDLKVELIDRFGLLPAVSQELFHIGQIRLQAQVLKIKKIEISAKFGYLYFHNKPLINVETVIKMIQIHPKQYQMQGADSLRFRIDHLQPVERSDYVKELLNKIS